MARTLPDVPLIGRSAELRLLRDAVRDAGQGEPSAVLVTGDAGVGKTRLLTELDRCARADGARVLLGHCVDLGEAGLPYLAFAEALAPLGQDAAAPALRRWLAGGQPGPVADGEVGQLQLFDSVLAALESDAEGRVTVLVLEDLHWADRSSRDLLAFLVRRLRSQRLLVVASVRSDDLHRRHPLRPLLAELARLPVVQRVELSPFSGTEMSAYVQALSGRLPGADLVQQLMDRSEGNPYFAEQLLAAGSGPDQPPGVLPGALADVLLDRVDALSAPAREVVRAAAVAGPRVDHPLLASATGLGPEGLDQALREAVTHHVLVPAGDGYAFRHALAREAVYGDLLPGERVRLHAVFAEALAARHADGPAPAGELARHRMESHDLAGALVASVLAAEEAERLQAPAEALQHLERVLQVWGAVPGAADVAGCSRLEVTLRAASAAGLAGLPARAVTLAEDAVAQTGEDDPRPAVLARRTLAAALLANDRTGDGLAAAREALAAAARHDLLDEHESGLAGALAARALAALGDADGAAAQAAQVLTVARRCQWEDVEADLLTTLAATGGEEGAARGQLERALALARRSGALGTELRVAYNLAVSVYESGDVAGAGGAVEAALARARETGLSWSAYGLELRVLQVIIAYARGDLEACRRLADLAGERPSEVVLARLSAAALPAAVARGDQDAAALAARLDGAWQHDGQIAMVAGGAGAELLRWSGDPQAALATVDRAIEHVARVWEPWFLGAIWLSAIGLGAAGDLAEHARLVADRPAQDRATEAATRLLSRAETTAERGRPRGGRMGPEGQAWLAVCHAEAARVRGAPDPALWRRALDGFERAARGADGCEAARCRWRLAEALLAAGDRDAAAREAGRAAATARRLAARPLLTALAATVTRGRLDTIDPGLPHDRVPAASGLTSRELQVLGLLAEGLTNREAGRRLYVSDKTVSVHVSNLLAKLGARSRTEAVTVAHRRGLLPEAVAAAGALSRSAARK